MTDFLQIARALEMQHNDVKWYDSVRAMADALAKADADAYERGVNDGLTGKRERAVSIRDEYAPPAGPIDLMEQFRTIDRLMTSPQGDGADR